MRRAPIEGRALEYIRSNEEVTTDDVRRHLQTYLQCAQSVLRNLQRKGLISCRIVPVRIARQWMGDRGGKRTGRRALWSASRDLSVHFDKKAQNE